jgi:hypothetical protein
MIPMSLGSNAVCNPATTAAATTTAANQKPKTPSITHNAGNGRKQTTAASSNRSRKSSLSANKLPAANTLSDNSHVASGTENTNVPLPAFEQAFGSTEIGRYSHEGFFSTTQQNENQQCARSEDSVNSTPDYNCYMSPVQIPTFESPMHCHQNQIQTVNQFSGFYNYCNHDYNQFHQHFSYSHNQFSHLNPLTNAPIKYENVLNY